MTEQVLTKKSKTSNVIGLDIGSYAIKCVEVDPSGDKPRLERVSILPVDLVPPESVSKALRHCLDPSLTLNRRVRISVSGGSSLLIRRIQMPAMTAAELKGAIRFEAEGHIPFPVDECELDFQILGEAPDKKTIHVLLVAAKRDFIQARLKQLEAVNIVPELIDVDIFCLINAYEVLGQSEENTLGLLNLGHNVSSFAIIHDKRPYFVREIPFGSKGLTDAIRRAKGVTEEEADHLKISADASLDARNLVLEGFEPLIEEIRHSVDYFENEFAEDLKVIQLSGGGALFPGTAETLSENLSRQVSIWDNTKKLDIFGQIDREYLSAHACELNVALGMALRGLGGEKMIEINLLPEAFRRKEKVHIAMPEIPIKKTLYWAGGGVVALQVLLMLAALYVRFESAALERKMNVLREQNKELIRQKSETLGKQNRVREIRSLTTRSFYWTSLLNALSASMTKGVWLRSFTITEIAQAPPPATLSSKKDKAKQKKAKKDKDEDEERSAKAAMPTDKYLILVGAAVGAGQETAHIGKFLKELKSNAFFNEQFVDIKPSNITQKQLGEVDAFEFTVSCRFRKEKSP